MTLNVTQAQNLIPALPIRTRVRRNTKQSTGFKLGIRLSGNSGKLLFISDAKILDSSKLVSFNSSRLEYNISAIKLVNSG